MMPTDEPIVGIDLGTTNSLCAVFAEGEPRLIRNVHGDVLTPSVVGVLESGEVLVGEAAKELLVTRPGQAVACFKRWMGDQQTTRLGEREFTAIEFSSLVLRSLREDATKELGVDVQQAVITVPAYFNEHQRKATKSAAELAGLTVRRIVNEPTAAALAYGFHDREAERQLLVVDLGGGTFDVTLMEVFEGTLEIVSTAGESQLGGEDFTSRLLVETLGDFGMQVEATEFRTPLLVARLRQECERAKRRLGEGESAVIRLPDERGEIDKNARSVEFSRERFADVCRPLLDRVAGPIDRAVRDGGAGPADVDEVILVGGATRMPVLRDFVARRLQTPPLSRIDPDRVVCLGAAVQAALIAEDRAVSDMVMTDVCPHTLGVDTAKEFGPEVRSGYYTPIIHRNTTIPVSCEHVFQTMSAGQREVRIVVYQGENRRVEKNTRLGELTVRDVPHGPAGQNVYIRFTYDLNGLLEVEAYAEGREQHKARVVLTHNAGSLSDEELGDAVKRMAELKYYPREDRESQRLLRTAERVIGEVAPMLRDQLESAVDAFESAMAQADRAMVDSARDTLLQALSALGFDERGRRDD